jgi:hypothetical protein
MRRNQGSAPATPPPRSGQTSSDLSSGDDGLPAVPTSADMRELTRRGLGNLQLTTPRRRSARQASQALIRSQANQPASILEETIDQKEESAGRPAKPPVRSRRGPKPTKAEQQATQTRAILSHHQPPPAAQAPIEPNRDTTQASYPQVGTAVKGKHFTQQQMPTYHYNANAGPSNLVSRHDASFLTQTPQQAAQILDHGGRISYARIGDTRKEAITRPIPAAPIDWRGWDDMRTRLDALHLARRQRQAEYRDRSQRAARRAMLNKMDVDDDEEEEEDIYN